ncbi:MAG: hypothetical protein IPP66_14610 [Anaerolineales bacterium]|nr:hypothetical protein [Anaerolineales bacterium]
MKRQLTLTILMISIFVSACGATTTPEPQFQSIPNAWIDSPLEGTTFPLGEIEIVSHTTDLTGIARVELSANGQVVRTDENPDSSLTLFVIGQKWTPSQPGQYLVQVRGQTTGGTWSNYAAVNITVIGATPTPVFTSTPTLVPTATFTPTPLPTDTPTAVPTADRPIYQTPIISGNQLYNVEGCGGPNRVQVSIIITNTTAATLYYSIGGGEWFAEKMTNTSGAQWVGAIQSKPSLGSYTGDLQYYIHMSNESTYDETPTYGGVTVLNCKP